MSVLGLILAGARGEVLGPLTLKRASAAVPVCGKYRAIDFTLSNMVNSGISKVGILTQYNPRSLMDHLGSGKEWNLDRKTGGLFILQPFKRTEKDEDWYRGTADAIFQNMTILKRGSEKDVLIASGDHIYKLDFSELFRVHYEKEADVTIVVKRLDESYDLTQYGIVELDEENRIIRFEEKPEKPFSNIASLGIYFMNKDFLINLLYDGIKAAESDGNESFDLVKDIFIPRIDKLRFIAYEFNGYWRNVKKGLNEYYRINMDFLKREIREELFYKYGKVYTKLKDLPSPKFTATADVKNSIVSDGCIVSGKVENSILFRSVTIKAGAVVKNSILMQGTVVEEGARVENAILDKNVFVRLEREVIGMANQPIIIEKNAVI